MTFRVGPATDQEHSGRVAAFPAPSAPPWGGQGNSTAQRPHADIWQPRGSFCI